VPLSDPGSRRGSSPGAVRIPRGQSGNPMEHRDAPGSPTARAGLRQAEKPGRTRFSPGMAARKPGRTGRRPGKSEAKPWKQRSRGKGWGGQTERAQKGGRGRAGQAGGGKRRGAKDKATLSAPSIAFPGTPSPDQLPSPLMSASRASPPPGDGPLPGRPRPSRPFPPPARPRPRTARRAPSAQIPRRDPRLRSDPRRIHRGWPGLPSRPRPGPPAIRPCPEGRFPETEAPQSRTTPTSPKARPALSTGFDPPTKNLPRSPSPPPSCPPLPPSPYGTGLRSHQPKRLPRRAFGPTDGLGGQRPFGPGGLPGGEAAARRAPCGRPRPRISARRIGRMPPGFFRPPSPIPARHPCDRAVEATGREPHDARKSSNPFAGRLQPKGTSASSAARTRHGARGSRRLHGFTEGQMEGYSEGP
jgi:hypothetical protein